MVTHSYRCRGLQSEEDHLYCRELDKKEGDDGGEGYDGRSGIQERLLVKGRVCTKERKKERERRTQPGWRGGGGSLAFLKCTGMQQVWLCVTLWAAAHQAPPSGGFSRQERCSGLPCPPPGIFPTQGSNPHLLHLLHWQAGSLPLVPPLGCSLLPEDRATAGLWELYCFSMHSPNNMLKITYVQSVYLLRHFRNKSMEKSVLVTMLCKKLF